MKTPYRIRKRLNPRNLNAEAKFYPAPYYNEMITTEELSKEISSATTLNEIDVSAVLMALSAKIMTYIQTGNKVKLDNLGIFKLAFSGKGRDKKSEVSASDIDDVHILFTPESKLKKMIKKFQFAKKDV